jgi:DNA-binding NtrC family response regulator
MNQRPYRICLIEDDAIMGEALIVRFKLEGFECDWFKEGRPALETLGRKRFDAVVSDIQLPDIDGEALFGQARGAGIELPPWIFITGYGAIDGAVRMLKLGAEDYLTKPLDIRALLDKVRSVCVRGRPSVAGEPALGISGAMRAIEAMLPKIANSAGTVLITGESGVGKEEVARALHRARDADGSRPFVAVNCGALTESLLEAELFGHVKGSFTGAVRDRKGLFEQADGGTLFLDEIGDTTPAMQVRLLRAIQERQIVRVGGDAPIPVDIRLVCATNRDLKRMVEAGEFREDLYYRIHVIHLHVPPLRERREDILWLTERLLARCAAEHGGVVRSLHRSAEKPMLDYPWPGNIRELKHKLERACILSARPALTPELLFGELPVPQEDAPAELLAEYLQACERRYIEQALRANRWRMAETAAALGISRKNLWEKMRKLGIAGAEG